MPNPMMMPGGMFGMVAGAPRKKPEEEKRQSYWQGGDKFTLRDGLAAGLAAVGDGFSNWANGGGGGATNMLVGGRINAMEQAKQARAQAEAAAASEQQRQRLRGEKLEDLRGELKVRGEFEGPDEPGVFEDNAGNRWLYDKKTGATLGQAPVFVDRAERYMNQNGAILNVPNPYATQQPQQLPTQPVGKITMVPQGGQPPQLQMNPQAQVYLDEAMKQEMLAGARRDGRDYMQRMGY